MRNPDLLSMAGHAVYERHPERRVILRVRPTNNADIFISSNAAVGDTSATATDLPPITESMKCGEWAMLAAGSKMALADAAANTGANW